MGEVGDRDLVFTEGLEGLGGELDVAEEADLAGFTNANLLDNFVLLLDLQDVPRLADVKALGVEIEGTEVVSRGDEPARLGAFASVGSQFLARLLREAAVGISRLLAQERFIGQADADEGTAGTLGTVHQRGRNSLG